MNSGMLLTFSYGSPYILFSFVFRKSTSLYNRRHTKIVTTLTSLFTSCYVFHWQSYFPDVPLRYPASFDGRIVLYPSEREVRDYFSWRQADSTSSASCIAPFWRSWLIFSSTYQ